MTRLAPVAPDCPRPKPGAPGRGPGRRIAAGWLVLAVLCGWLLWGGRAGTGRTVTLLVSGILLEALPFMMLGAFAGGLVEVFVSRETLAKSLPARPWLAIPAAAALGFAFPVCECGIIPIVRRFVRKGLPPGAAVAYLLGGPLVNPLVIASTAIAYGFDLRVVLIRIGVGYAIAVTAAGTVQALFDRASPIRADARSADGDEDGASRCACGHDHGHGHHHPESGAPPGIGPKLAAALRHGADDLLQVGHYLVIGAILAAAAQAYLDRGEVLRLSGHPIVPILAMMGLAFLLNLCSEADAFVAASLRTLVPLPAQMAFLLLGPMLDLKLLMMYRTLFRGRAILVIALLVLLMVLGAAWGIHLATEGMG
jgi:hypothetical protein